MIDLHDIRYVRLGTRNLDASARFAENIVGLEPVRSDGKARYFRSDHRDHTLVYVEGDPADHTVGFEVRSRDALDAAAKELSNAGFDVRQGTAAETALRGAERFVTFRDLTGNRIDLVLAADVDGNSFNARRQAGITGFSHVGLCTTDAKRDEAFWCNLLGARVSDRIGDAALLRIDPVHHKVALFPTTRAGVQHVNHQLATTDDVMRAWYFLRGYGVRIVFGPGRHPTSGATFVYFEGPDGMVYEYSSGVRLISPEDEATYRPRWFPRENASFCMWGAVPDIAEFKQS